MTPQETQILTAASEFARRKRLSAAALKKAEEYDRYSVKGERYSEKKSGKLWEKSRRAGARTGLAAHRLLTVSLGYCYDANARDIDMPRAIFG